MSNLMTWDDDLSIGIQELDEHHKKLFNLVNEIGHAVEEGMEIDQELDLLQQLHDHAAMHFAVEEGLMRVLKFPEYDEHRTEHAALMRRFERMVENIKDGRKAVDQETLIFIREWVSGHIDAYDKKMAPHLINYGVKTD